MAQEQPIWSPSQSAAQRVAKRRSTYYSRLNLWPFVGVMMALVFLFLPVAPHAHIWRKPVDRPQVAHPTPQPGAVREDSVQVSVTRDGNIFCNGKQVQIGDLPEVIKSSMQASTEKKIYVAADARAKYGDVKAVVEKIRLTGIRQICFLVEKKKPY